MVKVRPIVRPYTERGKFSYIFQYKENYKKFFPSPYMKYEPTSVRTFAIHFNARTTRITLDGLFRGKITIMPQN